MINTKIDREGTFRGVVLDHGVGMTKNEYPQFVFKFRAEEIWDADEGEWVDWTDMAETDATGYMVLFGGQGETLNCKQVKGATGWDGDSFQGLNDIDLSEVKIQVRMEWNTYNDKTDIQVNWIDAGDAVPGGTVKKLDPDKIKDLDAKYAKLMKGKKTAKPAKAGASKPTKAKDKPKSAAKGKAKAPAGPPKTTKTKAPKPPTDEVAGSCTKDEAWADVSDNDIRRKDVTDEDIAKLWLDTVAEVCGDEDEDALTNEDWFTIKEKVIDSTSLF